MSRQPTTQVFSRRVATTEACEVWPPREVTSPSVSEISRMSSGTVSWRMRIRWVSGSSRRSWRMLSSLNTALPIMAEPDTPMPLARIALWARSESSNTIRCSFFLMVIMSRVWRMYSCSGSGPSKVNSISWAFHSLS